MNEETRIKYAEYIAMCLEKASRKARLEWPDDTILCVKTYSHLATLDEIVGMKIWVVNIPCTDNFFVAIPAGNTDSHRLVKAFSECMERYDLNYNIECQKGDRE